MFLDLANFANGDTFDVFLGNNLLNPDLFVSDGLTLLNLGVFFVNHDIDRALNQFRGLDASVLHARYDLSLLDGNLDLTVEGNGDLTNNLATNSFTDAFIGDAIVGETRFTNFQGTVVDISVDILVDLELQKRHTWNNK